MFFRIVSLLFLFQIMLNGITVTYADDFEKMIENRSLSTSACSNKFLHHLLDHVTTPMRQPIGYYDSNGGGVAINDLNNDGLLDITVANLAGDNAIFWNQGNLDFEREPLPSISPSRSVSIVDVDGDNWMDIVFTHLFYQ